MMKTVTITGRGKPAILLRNYDARTEGKVREVLYYERLCHHMPARLSAHDRRALDEDGRRER